MGLNVPQTNKIDPEECQNMDLGKSINGVSIHKLMELLKICYKKINVNFNHDINVSFKLLLLASKYNKTC